MGGLRMATLCSRDDCPAGQGNGRCFEGLEDPTTCKNWIDEVDENEPAASDASTRQVTPFLIGGEMDLAGAQLLALAYPVKTIAVVGDEDSGKTTLIAALYCAFWSGPLRNWSFAGSRTIVEFERKAHLARMSSGAEYAKVERTRTTGGLHFLHLACQRDHAIQHLLVSDRAGEDYQAARSTSEACRRLVELKLADKVLYLIDGLRLGHARYRANAISTAVQFLRRAVDTSVLDLAKVEIVVTKADYLDVASSNDPKLRPAIDADLERMRSVLGNADLRIRYLSPLSIKHPQEGERACERARLADALDEWTRHEPEIARTQPVSRDELSDFLARIIG
jgi:hypothetical protein